MNKQFSSLQNVTSHVYFVFNKEHQAMPKLIIDELDIRSDGFVPFAVMTISCCIRRRA